MTYDSDTEAAHERTGLLGGSEQTLGTPDSLKPPKGRVLRFLHFFAGGIYAPDASTYDPIEIFLNEEDPKERDRLTEVWRDNRLAELNFVGVVAALLAGVLTSTGSWPDILPDGRDKPWPVRTAWYCGIILSLFSILTAADQTVRLRRLSSHRDAWKNIRKLLSKPKGKPKRSKKTGRIQPQKGTVYTLQLPVMFLTTATLCMIIGMFLHVWSAASIDWDQFNSNTKMALTFSIVAALSIGIFFAGQVSLYAPPDDDELE